MHRQASSGRSRRARNRIRGPQLPRISSTEERRRHRLSGARAATSTDARVSSPVSATPISRRAGVRVLRGRASFPVPPRTFGARGRPGGVRGGRGAATSVSVKRLQQVASAKAARALRCAGGCCACASALLPHPRVAGGRAGVRGTPLHRGGVRERSHQLNRPFLVAGAKRHVTPCHATLRQRACNVSGRYRS